jgi:hypothetical protein
MTHYWQPTAEGYFGRVSQGLILEAVREGIGPGAAGKIDGLKKDAMAKRAEALLAGKRWLPTFLRWRLRLAPARKAGASVAREAETAPNFKSRRGCLRDIIIHS